MLKLIIQIPAFNEETTISRTLADLPKQIGGIGPIETLLIDDGSTDRTVEAARKAGVTHVVRLLSHRGLSTAFVAGIDAALRLGADIIVNTDADNQYRGSDIAALVAPIVQGTSEVVIGDRDVRNSPHMSGSKRLLQTLGSWAVGKASGLEIPDVTSGLRAFSREAAFQINVFNPFTYTLETIIQAGNRNLGLTSVTVGTNPPTRPSRLYRGIGSYLRKSVVTIFRIYTLYKPLKTFFLIGLIPILGGTLLGGRFLFHYLRDGSAGHVQSLILAAILLIVGFQTMLIGLVADLISVNRRLSEELLIRMRKMDPRSATHQPPQAQSQPQRIQKGPRERQHVVERHHAPRPRTERPAGEPAASQWVWLLDEKEREERENKGTSSNAVVTPEKAERPAVAGAVRPRRRRRRRPSPAQSGVPDAPAKSPESE